MLKLSELKLDKSGAAQTEHYLACRSYVEPSRGDFPIVKSIDEYKVPGTSELTIFEESPANLVRRLANYHLEYLWFLVGNSNVYNTAKKIKSHDPVWNIYRMVRKALHGSK